MGSPAAARGRARLRDDLGEGGERPACGMPQRSWPSGTPRRRLHKPFPGNGLRAQHRVRSIEGAWKFSGRRLRWVADGVGFGLLHEARAKLARQQVKSERPGLPAGAFAFPGRVLPRLSTKGCVRGGLSRWASAVAWPSSRPTLAAVSPGVSLGASRNPAHRKVSC